MINKIISSISAKKTVKVLFFPVLVFLSGFSMSQEIFPQIEKYKLKNGLEVIFADFGNLPVTSFHFIVNTGSRDETEGQQGLSEITVNSLMAGSAGYDRIKGDELQYRMGTRVRGTAGEQYTYLSMDFLNKDEGEAFDYLANLFLYPSFPKVEITENIGQMVQFETPAKLDILKLARVYSDYFVFGKQNPLGRNMGSKQLNAITIEQIREFYQFHYTPGNTKIIICGKPDRNFLKEKINEYFGKWKAVYGETNASSYETQPIKKKEAGFISKPGATQAALVWAKSAPSGKSADVLPFEISRIVFNGLLYEEIREKEGKTYAIGTDYEAQANTGVYSILTQVRAEVLKGTISTFDRVLEEFYKNGISEDQLQIAKTKMKNQFLSMEGPSGMVGLIHPFMYPDYKKRSRLMEEIDALDLKTINKIIKKYYDPVSYKLVISGDEKVLESQLNALGIPLIRFSINELE